MHTAKLHTDHEYKSDFGRTVFVWNKMSRNKTSMPK